jgi:hypothetical protein
VLKSVTISGGIVSFPLLSGFAEKKTTFKPDASTNGELLGSGSSGRALL